MISSSYTTHDSKASRNFLGNFIGIIGIIGIVGIVGRDSLVLFYIAFRTLISLSLGGKSSGGWFVSEPSNDEPGS